MKLASESQMPKPLPNWRNFATSWIGLALRLDLNRLDSNQVQLSERSQLVPTAVASGYCQLAFVEERKLQLSRFCSHPDPTVCAVQFLALNRFDRVFLSFLLLQCEANQNRTKLKKSQLRTLNLLWVEQLKTVNSSPPPDRAEKLLFFVFVRWSFPVVLFFFFFVPSPSANLACSLWIPGRTLRW